MMPISPNEIIIFGGGKACDFAAPSYGSIPSDCYLVNIQACSRPGSKKLSS